MMLNNVRSYLLTGLLALLVACGGGGGGNSASGVEAGPPPSGGPVDPPPPAFPSPAPYAEAEELVATITDVTLDENDRAVVQFQLTDGNGAAITDLAAENVRFIISKLQVTELGNLTGTWQSYVNRVETPEHGEGTEPRLQATTESDGEFVNHTDGSYTYTFTTSLSELDEGILEQAASEGLNLDYESDRTHRVAIQFDGAPGKANPNYDWEPASGATEGVFSMDIAATENCNNCHTALAFHGGGRREIEYCVACHNPGTTDSDSTNTVDMKVMIHKIHMGKNLPSVQAGGEYVIYGFNGSKHDYSGLSYPQDIRNCVNCHVGTGTAPEGTSLVLTAQGDNWSEYPTRAACGSCHENVNFDKHQGGQEDDSECAGCHSSGWTRSAHTIPLEEARKAFEAQILSIENTMPGQQPVVQFKVHNPETGEDYDLNSDPEFSTEDGASLNVGIAWNTIDYTNTGNGGNNASQVQVDALTESSDNGDGSYTVTLPAIPGTGSGAATIDGHPKVDIDEDGETDSVPVGDVVEYFSIDEADGTAVVRRTSVDIQNCLACHGSLILHGSNRADNIENCVTCHNPRNTDRRVREMAQSPPTDGKDEESIDFKTMVHGIHAPSIRENALQIVGYMGYNTHVYDEEHVHYPGNLADCTACHTEDGFTLPLDEGVLGTTIDTGSDIASPDDDTVITPVTAACSSCHDDDGPNSAKSHMEFYGGSFSTTQSAIDSGEVHEDCSSCHKEGSGVADAWEVHQRFLN